MQATTSSLCEAPFARELRAIQRQPDRYREATTDQTGPGSLPCGDDSPAFPSFDRQPLAYVCVRVRTCVCVLFRRVPFGERSWHRVGVGSATVTGPRTLWLGSASTEPTGVLTMRCEVLSPDGISIEGRSYRSHRAALRALTRWVRRYEWQGFYSTARWERIPLEELPGRCRLIRFPKSS